MANWVLRGLRTGIKSTALSGRTDDAPGVSPGRPAGTLVEMPKRRTPGAALPDRGDCREGNGGSPSSTAAAFIACAAATCGAPATWEPGYEWARPADETEAARRSSPASSAARCTSALSMPAPAALA